MKVWISKYALTNGIQFVECLENRGSDRRSKFVSREGYVFTRGSAFGFKLGLEAHETKEEAIVRVELMRLKKIASLKKQIANLEAMKFEE